MGTELGRILVVDDTPDNIKVIAGILQDRGYGISFANSGSQALDILARTRPDLILLDIVMPGMNGFETCAKIKANPDLAGIPVIFLTSLTDTGQVVRGLGAGAVDYLTKPVEKEILLARVNTHLTIRAFQKELEARVDQRTDELRQALGLIDGILASMPSVLISLDARGRVTHWNPRAEERTGVKRADALGRTLDTLLDHPAVTAERVREVGQGKGTFRENRVACFSGQRICYENITIYALNGSHRLGVVIHMEDVTDQVRAEEVMIQSEKMMSLGNMAAGIAHEINNPLAGMVQNAELLQRLLLDNGRALDKQGETAFQAFLAAKKIPRLLSNIREAGHKAARIVSDMLSLAQQPDPQKVSYDMARLMDDTLALASRAFHPLSRNKFARIRIVKAYGPDLPRVMCEPSKLQQVFVNILQNGAYAMNQDGGSGPPWFKITMEQAGDWLEIRIQDNGPGMDAAVRSRIFNPFFTTKPPGDGTGLGLSISYFIVVNTHGGELSVRSAPGAGTCFLIRLPLMPARGG